MYRSSKKILVIFLLLSAAFSVMANENLIEGNWVTKNNKHGKSIINIYSDHNGIFYGKIIKMKNEKQLDKNNPDSSLKNKPLLGKVILKDLKYNGGQWDNGKIYDPDNGKTYSCKLWLDDPNTLKIRGFIGFAFLGRTAVWTRQNEKGA